MISKRMTAYPARKGPRTAENDAFRDRLKGIYRGTHTI
jgi:hypothetical protein